jgi:small-conductance mechanosensitive channel
MRTTFTHFLVSFFILIFATFPVYSQSSLVPNALKSTEDTLTGSENFVEVMKQAAENGVQVIVVDTQGNNLGAPSVDAEGAEPADTMSGVMKAQTSAVKFREILVKRLHALPVAFEEVDYILRANSPTGELWAYFEALLWSLLFFAIGYLVEIQIYGKRIIPKIFELKTRENPIGYTEKMPFLVSRFLLRASGVFVSMAVAYVIGSTLFGAIENSGMRFTVTLINIAYASCRLVSLLWRMILAPYACQYRIPQFSNKDALRLYHWLWVVAIIDICTVVISIWVFELGLTYDVFALITAILASLVVLLNIGLIAANKNSISRAIRNGAELTHVGWLGRFVSSGWASVVIFYLLFSWGDLVYRLVLEQPLSKPAVLGGYGVLTAIRVVYAIINYLIERFFHRTAVIAEINSTMLLDADTSGDDTEVVEEVAAAKHPLASFEDLARRVAGVLAFVAGLWALLSIWHVESGMQVADSYVDRSLDIVAILFIGYIVYHAFRIWIDSKIEEEGGDEIELEPGDEGGGSSASRLATLLPLFRNFILVVVVVTIALIALLEMGINVSPLFAGAGVAGLAIGFGAQTLVRDIFSGAFFLVDDAFRKGEYIDVGSVKGTVEKISVRSFQLRHHLGPLHTIPFGEIQVLTNYSRDWVMMKLPLRVTYDTDVEKVRKLIKKLGLELMEDPVIGDNFLQPLKSQGVIEMQDSAMIIRVKFMTKPGDQWIIRKRVFQEIRDLFEREGIKFAHRQVTVRLAGDNDPENLTQAQKTAIAGAALAAGIDDEAMDENEGAGE